MNTLSCDTVAYNEEDHALVIIDQTLLPGKVELLSLTKLEDVWEAIRALRVRGAPAIGVAAAYGLAVRAEQLARSITERDAFLAALDEAAAYLDSSRPTAVNLSWALRRMTSRAKETAEADPARIADVLLAEAKKIHAEDTEMCRKIGEYGLTLVKPGDGILTHCNAGRLATSKYGTATAPMYLGHERGYNFRIYADETRPLLQGARLTSYELSSAGLDVTLLCDNMSATLMRKGLINAVFVGCDRMASNGDFANKIGTSMVALAAARYHVPFYTCLPTTSIDMSLSSGDEIVIEQRAPEEVTELWYAQRMAPQGIRVFNPAFDVTDADLVTAIITEKGIARPPFTESLAAMMA